jgi:hypothetical protein
MSIKQTPAILLLLPLALVVACTNKDREQAAKKSDGVESFRYVPGDPEKYIKRNETTPSSIRPKGSAPNAPRSRSANDTVQSTNVRPEPSPEK